MDTQLLNSGRAFCNIGSPGDNRVPAICAYLKGDFPAEVAVPINRSQLLNALTKGRLRFGRQIRPCGAETWREWLRLTTRPGKMLRGKDELIFYRGLARCTGANANITQISSRTGFTNFTVKKLVNRAIEKGLWIEIPPLPSSSFTNQRSKNIGFLCDSGLVAHLMSIRTKENAPKVHQAMWLTAVLSDTITNINQYLNGPNFYYWARGSSTKIDLIFQIDGIFHPILIAPFRGGFHVSQTALGHLIQNIRTEIWGTPIIIHSGTEVQELWRGIAIPFDSYVQRV